MKKLSLLLSLAVCACAPAHAQLWCPPGATWNYNLLSFGVEGCETRTYDGDTIIDGRFAQRILVNRITMNYMSGVLDTTNTVFYTSHDSGLVYAWDVLSSGSWDTLYWFNAHPGDRWYPAAADGLCPDQYPLGMLQTADTGHVVIGGQWLRYVDVAFLDEAGQQDGNPFTIIERLGAPLMVIPPNGCFVSEAGGSLRTYDDASSLSYDSGEPNTCDQLTGFVGQFLPKPVFGVYPNPANNWIRITNVPSRSAIFSIVDMRGQVVFTGNASGDGRLSIDFLASGYYVLWLFDHHGTSHGYAPLLKQ